MPHVTISGKLTDGLFQRCKKAAEFIASHEPEFTADILSLLPTDFEVLSKEICLSMGTDPDYLQHKANVLCFEGAVAKPGKYIGAGRAFMSWLGETYGYSDKKTNAAMYERLAKLHLRHVIKESGHTFVFFEIGVAGRSEGKIICELFDKACPKTVANFKALTEGHEIGCYKDTPVHRIVPQGWIQAGDIKSGNGDKGVSIYGESFADETFIIKHDKPGVLGMVNIGPHTNNSQFYITVAPLPWLNGKSVAFGRVVDGMRLLRIIERSELENERPTQGISIIDCGIYNAGAAPPPPAPPPAPPA